MSDGIIGPPGTTDVLAIHKSTPAEISTVTAKALPIGADLILIEDSADANNKKRIQIGNLPSGTDANAVHINVASEISAITSKATPIGTDILLMEDSASANAKKSFLLSSIPHSQISGIGTNTHAQIDTHIASVANPHAVTKAQVGLTNVTDDAQLKRASADFTSFAVKAVPVGADTLLIEDSASADAKKKITINTIQHTDLSAIGTNSHAQIDTHLASVANPHATTKAQVGLTNVTDDAQLKRASGDLNTFTSKAVPVGADILLIEDSADSFNKKKILVSSLLKLTTGIISGLTMSYISASTVEISTGFCRSSSDSFDIVNTTTRQASLAVSGIGGLDTGAEAISTWYAVHIIDDSTGVNTEGIIFSLSANAPTLPVGYNGSRRIGWVRNDGAGNILKFNQRRGGATRFIYYDVEESVVEMVTAGASTVYTAVSLATVIPPTATEFIIGVQMASDNHNEYVFFRPTGSTITASPFRFSGNSNNNTRFSSDMATLPCSSSQSIDYRVSVAADRVDFNAMGYVDNL